MAYVLKEHFGYQGHAEGHYLDLMDRLTGFADEHFRQRAVEAAIADLDVRAQSWRSTVAASHVGLDRIVRDVESLFVGYAASLYGERWFDKTPGAEMILAAPRLAALFPRARFICLVRDPISNVESRLRKFPSSTFVEHCQEWAGSARAWLAVRGQLPARARLELMTHELASDPDGTFAKVRALLEDHFREGEIPARPRFGGFPKIEQTRTTDPAAVRSLDDVDWADAQRQAFIEICGPLAEQFDFARAPRPRDADDAIVLPPPWGQRDVEARHGTGGGIWPEPHGDEIWTFLHPSAGGEPTTLTYRNVPARGRRQLRARAVVRSPLGPPVRFTLSLSASGSGTPLCSEDFVCHPGEQREVAMTFTDAREDLLDLSITSASAGATTNYAWALIAPIRIA